MTVYTDDMTDMAHQAYRAGLHAQAEALLRLVVGHGAHDAHALYFIGHLCHLQGRLHEAQAYLDLALTIDPDNAFAHNDMGETLRALGLHDRAIPHFQRAIALQPHLAQPYGNLATALLAIGRPDDALAWAQRGLARGSDQAIAHCDMGNVLMRLNRVADAIAQYDRALALRPHEPRATYLLALARLSLGDWPAGWDAHEARLRLPPALGGRRSYQQTTWRGQSGIAGQRILLHAEQGHADTIQFARFAPLVARYGAIVSLEVQPGLRALLRDLPGIAAIHEFGEPIPPFTLHCPLMSLPAVFRTTLGTLPPPEPAIIPPPARAAAWAQRLGTWRRMRVGLAWSDNAAPHPDPDRTLPPGLLAGLVNRDDIDCHVIQGGIRPADAAAVAALPRLADHSAALVDFTETAALLAQMDLVITVDTALAHLAGAMGKPAWVLLAHAADWRWMHDRADTPWYPTLRLFRQPARDDWASVLAAVARQLDLWAVPRA